ncbi:hypothetical protein ACIQWB_37065 [Streptomyces olivaceus]|uniref:hypothetical protein n=1 Tax=Streptomyces olivaceus TaxID=47716 RepID=UPI0038022845
MTIKQSHTLRLLAAGSLSAALVAMSTGVAHAGNFKNRTISVQPSGVTAGKASFKAKGDRLTICDTVADGYSVSVTVFDEDNKRKKIYKLSVGGKGKCKTSTKNLVDGHRHSFWSDTTGSTGGMGRIGYEVA